MSHYRPTRPTPPLPLPTDELALVVTAAPVREEYDEIRIGERTAIRLNHGSRAARIDPPLLSSRLHVNGIGEVAEVVALELVRELLTGVVELRRRNATDGEPFDANDVTRGDFEVRLSTRPVDYARTTTADPGA